MQTVSGSEKWALEVYNETFDPVVENDSSIASQVSVLINTVKGGGGFSTVVQKSFEKLYTNETNKDEKFLKTGNPSVMGFGITAINMNRSKSHSSTSCTISAVGDIPQYIAVGSWVIVSSFSSLISDNPESGALGALGSVAKAAFDYFSSSEDDPGVPVEAGMPTPRFIGQIESVTAQYAVGSDGLLMRNTTIQISEWSKLLSSPIRFDKLSLMGNLLQSSNVSDPIKAVNFVSQVDNSAVVNVFAKAFDPIEFVHTTLSLYGAINTKDIVSEKSPANQIANGEAFLSSIPPKVPDALIKRIGFSAGELGPGGSNYSNFINNIFGVLLNKDHIQKDGWNGVFKDSGVTKLKNAMKQGWVKRSQDIRSESAAPMTLISRGMSGWDFIQSAGERHIFEYFTDLWYEQTEGGGVRTVPVFISRDKPYTLKYILESPEFANEYGSQIGSGLASAFAKYTENPTSVLSGTTSGSIASDIKSFWTLFDNLPRIRVKKGSIKQFGVMTSADSPNQYTPRINNSLMNQNLQQTQVDLNGRILQPHMMRKFGTREYKYETRFWVTQVLDKLKEGSLTKLKTSADIMKMYSELIRMWQSYLYRMPSANLTLKDPDLKISVGMNMQFDVGYFTVVGHVSAYNANYVVEPDGSEVSTTNVVLERCVIVTRESENSTNLILKPMPHGGWNRLGDSQFAQSLLSASSNAQISFYPFG